MIFILFVTCILADQHTFDVPLASGNTIRLHLDDGDGPSANLAKVIQLLAQDYIVEVNSLQNEINALQTQVNLLNSAVFGVSTYTTPPTVPSSIAAVGGLLGNQELLALAITVDFTDFTCPVVTVVGNLRIVSGNASDDTNGCGNQVMGYGQNFVDISGSHNIVLGEGHEVDGYCSVVGGTDNTLGNDVGYAFIGGTSNGANQDFCFVATGQDNTCAGTEGAILDGILNTITGGKGEAIIDGAANSITGTAAGDGGLWDVIVGGTKNVIAANTNNATVGSHNVTGVHPGDNALFGGFHNQILNSSVTIDLGDYNSTAVDDLRLGVGYDVGDETIPSSGPGATKK